MRLMAVVVLAIAACGSPASVPPDSRPPDLVVDGKPGCPALPGAADFDFFGEACHADPFPANTTCHAGDKGWCIDGTCRPMSSIAGCAACPADTERFAPAGGAYCQPPS